MSRRHEIADGLIVLLPRAKGDALPWWRFEDGTLVESGMDVDPVGASLFDPALADNNLVALLPAAISRAEWTTAEPGLAEKQAEALAARSVAEKAIGGLERIHAVAGIWAGSTDADVDNDRPDEDEQADALLLAILVAKAELAHGLGLLAELGIDPTHVVPAYCAAQYAAALSGAGPAIVELAGEPIFVGDRLLMPADAALISLLAPDSDPAEIAPPAVEEALAVMLADPPLDMLTGAFARRRRLPRLHAQQWKTLGWLVVAVVVATLLIGLVTMWRYGTAADDADARSLAAMEAVLGDQGDLGAAEIALDQRLASTGRGAALFTVPLSALYQAMQAVPQVSVRQIGYVGDGTLSVSLAAPDAAPVNQMLRSLQDAGYAVTGDSRVDATGSSVFDITLRGY